MPAQKEWIIYNINKQIEEVVSSRAGFSGVTVTDATDVQAIEALTRK